MKHRQFAFLLATLVVTSGGDSRAETWRSYHNTRFGTAAGVPASWTMGPEPANDDGRKFTSPDKHAEITISGHFANVDTDDELASRLEAGEGETIKFKKRQANGSSCLGPRAIVFSIARLCCPAATRSPLTFGSNTRPPRKKNTTRSSLMSPPHYGRAQVMA